MNLHPRQTMQALLLESLWRPIDHAWLVALRLLIGLLVFISAARTLFHGWAERFFISPDFMFSYHGLAWLPRPPAEVTMAMFVTLAISGLLVAAGALYRVAILTAFLLFTYLELLDVTNYLNHYYLLSLLTLLMCFLPAHKDLSVDALRSRKVADATVYAWQHGLMRFQLAVVYFWAGMAKFGSDWLLHAQPLEIWLRARQETPLIGPLLSLPHSAHLMSWAGFLFDTTIWLFLLWPRTRKPAYIVLVVFHLSTGLLFNIGMFPWIMTCAATCFFAASWPRRLPLSSHLLRPSSPRPSRLDGIATAPPPRRHLVCSLLVVYCLLQALFPARHWLYPGSVLWNEEGMRWSWKVMVREKNGAITYRVTLPGKSREILVPPTRYLTDHQSREMSGQPDLIWQLGRHIGHDVAQRYAALPDQVEVRVDAWVSLNGRAPARLIDPDADLMRVEESPWRSTPWILPEPDDAPP